MKCSEILFFITIDRNQSHNINLYLEIPTANEKLNLDVVGVLQVLKSSIDVVKVPVCTALDCNLWTIKTTNNEVPTYKLHFLM